MIDCMSLPQASPPRSAGWIRQPDAGGIVGGQARPRCNHGTARAAAHERRGRDRAEVGFSDASRPHRHCGFDSSCSPIDFGIACRRARSRSSCRPFRAGWRDRPSSAAPVGRCCPAVLDSRPRAQPRCQPPGRTMPRPSFRSAAASAIRIGRDRRRGVAPASPAQTGDSEIASLTKRRPWRSTTNAARLAAIAHEMRRHRARDPSARRRHRCRRPDPA